VRDHLGLTPTLSHGDALFVTTVARGLLMLVIMALRLTIATLALGTFVQGCILDSLGHSSEPCEDDDGNVSYAGAHLACTGERSHEICFSSGDIGEQDCPQSTICESLGEHSSRCAVPSGGACFVGTDCASGLVCESGVCIDPPADHLAACDAATPWSLSSEWSQLDVTLGPSLLRDNAVTGPACGSPAGNEAVVALAFDAGVGTIEFRLEQGADVELIVASGCPFFTSASVACLPADGDVDQVQVSRDATTLLLQAPASALTISARALP
jgi:hypothetical protein